MLKPAIIDRLPMWLSFAVATLGIIVSSLLARLARGGALFAFTLLLTVGILVFSLHHVAELTLTRGTAALSEGLEALASLIFLAAALYLGYRLRKTVDGK